MIRSRLDDRAQVCNNNPKRERGAHNPPRSRFGLVCRRCRKLAYGALGFLVVILTWSLSGCAPEPVAAPTSYTSYNAKTGAFRCDYPAGWEVTGGGRGELYNASFKKGSASIAVKADLAGSLMAGPPINVADLPDELRPEVRLHEMGKTKISEEMGGYQEQEAVHIETPLGQGMKSEFTAAGAIGRKIHGYRVTVLSHDMRITVICQTPEGQWETLKSAFDKVIQSLALGRKE